MLQGVGSRGVKRVGIEVDGDVDIAVFQGVPQLSQQMPAALCAQDVEGTQFDAICCKVP